MKGDCRKNAKHQPPKTVGKPSNTQNRLVRKKHRRSGTYRFGEFYNQQSMFNTNNGSAPASQGVPPMSATQMLTSVDLLEFPWGSWKEGTVFSSCQVGAWGGGGTCSLVYFWKSIRCECVPVQAAALADTHIGNREATRPPDQLDGLLLIGIVGRAREARGGAFHQRRSFSRPS